MKTFDEIFQEVIKDKSIKAVEVFESTAKIYAKQVTQDALNRAAENAILCAYTGRGTNEEFDTSGKIINVVRGEVTVKLYKESITNTEIKLP